VRPFYAAFGFQDLRVALSTRPDDRAGDEESWDRAEAALRAVLGRLGWAYDVQPGAGAFYGPKIELALGDRHGRSWQCGTIQFDLVMPRRFDLRYVAPGGEKVPVVMLHRALYGSLERFLGMVLEQHGAALPPWLAPEQVHVLPVGPEHQARAGVVGARLRDVGLRVSVVAASDSLARRIALAHERAVPFVAVLGGREVDSGTVALRLRDGQRVLSVEATAAELGRIGRSPFRSSGSDRA
jgi:threonyl-tRNA synthetase